MSRVQKHFPNRSLTEQSHKDSCDINLILNQALRGAPVLHNRPELPTNINAPTFHEAMNMVAEAKSSFASLPAKLRAFFRNDMGYFVDFCSDEKNRPQLIELGLIPRPKVPKSTKPAKAPKQAPQEAQIDIEDLSSENP